MKTMHGMKRVAGRLLACALLTCVMAASAGQVKMDAEVDRVLTEQLNWLLGRIKPIEGQQSGLSGTVRLDLETCHMRVDLPRGFVPRYNGGEFEDQLSNLSGTLWHYSRKLGCDGSAAFMFGGLDINHYFPEDAVPPRFSFGGLKVSTHSGFSEETSRHLPVPASSSRPIVRRF